MRMTIRRIQEDGKTVSLLVKLSCIWLDAYSFSCCNRRGEEACLKPMQKQWMVTFCKIIGDSIAYQAKQEV